MAPSRGSVMILAGAPKCAVKALIFRLHELGHRVAGEGFWDRRGLVHGCVRVGCRAAAMVVAAASVAGERGHVVRDQAAMQNRAPS